MQDSDRGEGSSRARRVGKTGKNATTADRLVPSEMPLGMASQFTLKAEELSLRRSLCSSGQPRRHSV